MIEKKKIKIGIFVFICLSLVCCLFIFVYYLYLSVSIETKKLSQKNPTSYTFNGNLEQVRKKIISAIDFPSDFDVPFPFKNSQNAISSKVKRNLIFHDCKASDDSCLGTDKQKLQEIFKKKENQNDIYLVNDGSRMYSTTYYVGGKPLEFNMEFHIHLEAIADNKTRVTILPVNPTVLHGYGGRGLHGARLKKKVPVEPTTVEEYQLLRYLGLASGEKDMPEVILPK